MSPTLFIFSIEEIFELVLDENEEYHRARLRRSGLRIDPHATFLMIREAFQRHVDDVVRRDGLPPLRVVVTPRSSHTEESALWLERASREGWTIVENLDAKMDTSDPLINDLWHTYRIGEIVLDPARINWIRLRFADADDDEDEDEDEDDTPGASGSSDGNYPGYRRFGWDDDDLGPDLTRGAGLSPNAAGAADPDDDEDDTPGASGSSDGNYPGYRRFGWDDDDLGPDLTRGAGLSPNAAGAADPDDDDLSDLKPIPPDPEIEALIRELLGGPAAGPVIQQVGDPHAAAGLVQSAIDVAIDTLLALDPVPAPLAALAAAIRRVTADPTQECEVTVYDGLAVIDWPAFALEVPYTITGHAAVVAPPEQWHYHDVN